MIYEFYEPEILCSVDETLKYLGYKGQDISDEMLRDINLCTEYVLKAIQCRYILQKFEAVYTPYGVNLKGTSFSLGGNDIREHLGKSKYVVLMASTLGHEVDRLIKMTQHISLSRAVIMDAVCTTAIEEVCDGLQQQLYDYESKNGFYITERYSPGYGDLPISVQPDFLNVISAQKYTGITCNSDFLMIPQKSVTALLGVKLSQEKSNESDSDSRFKKCLKCRVRKNCTFRKNGTFCTKS